MTFRVMIVEDEPPIIRYINRLISDCNRGFTVVATAENGMEAMEKIKAEVPDVVVTDVRMPVMDGIALIKELRRKYPEVYTVIVSGYQDFEYAKEALKAGAVDYLLKPLEPRLLDALLEEMGAALAKRRLEHGKYLLARLIDNKETPPGDLKKYLRYRCFFAVLVRFGARYCAKAKAEAYESAQCPITHLEPADLEKEFDFEQVWVLEGRDANEAVVIAASNIPVYGRFGKLCGLLELESSRIQLFHTITYTPYPFEIRKLAPEIKRLAEACDNQVILGKSQLLKATEKCKNIESAFLSSIQEKKLTFLITGRILEGLKTELISLFEKWEREERPQVWLEAMTLQILHLVEKSLLEGVNFADGLEKQLSEAFSCSHDFAGLLRGFWDILEETVAPPEKSGDKEPSFAFYQKLLKYIKNNLSEPITLQGICDEFGVSQPYLSRLFRRYSSMSFKDYLTELRINSAVSLMKETNGMLLKDIAEIVGYRDPFYFSKVFKSTTGRTPTEYINELKLRNMR